MRQSVIGIARTWELRRTRDAGATLLRKGTLFRAVLFVAGMKIWSGQRHPASLEQVRKVLAGEISVLMLPLHRQRIELDQDVVHEADRKSTRLNSSHQI